MLNVMQSTDHLSTITHTRLSLIQPLFLLFEFSKLSTSGAHIECSRLYKAANKRNVSAPCELYNFVE